ncbi:hypothetical protein A0H81_01226 [Grifola frondosa]|uniref:Uncharacterized protein n=1 Tax=Grifola frondosa TaxID=5627 RepID=A0A1C7MRP0_GRIFR|nr:hypothetical protein A0H81_01226 [Grifola frondosa]
MIFPQTPSTPADNQDSPQRSPMDGQENPRQLKPLPLEYFDSEVVLKAHLSRMDEPTGPIDIELHKARAQVLKVRIRDVEQLRASMPYRSYDVDKEIATLRYRRKILLWVTFPIDELPVEILSNVFRYVVWSSEGADQATRHRLYLTWVSRHWREVSIDDKTLWNSVWFRDKAPWTRSLAFLDRAGTAPLDLRINERERRPTDKRAPTKITPYQIQFLLDRVLRKVDQIRILVIVLDTWQSTLVALHKFSQCGLPVSMERFELHRTGKPFFWVAPSVPFRDIITPVVLCRETLPKLKWLCLNGISVDWYRLPLTNLTTIDIRRIVPVEAPDSNRWVEMLKASPNLFKLALDAAWPQPVDDMAAVQRVELPHLRDFLLGDMNLTCAMFVLAHMHAPRVMNLALMNLGREDFGPLFQAITGHFTQIKLLSIYTVEIARTAVNRRIMVKWMESMPHLRMLKIAQAQTHLLKMFLENPHDYRDPDEMDCNPTAPDGLPPPRPVLCPKLDYLLFLSQDNDSVVALVEGRYAIGAPFSKLYIPQPHLPQVPEEIRRRLRMAVGEMLVTVNLALTPPEEEIHAEMAASVEVTENSY